MNNQLRLKGYVHDVRRTSKGGTASSPFLNFSLQVSQSRKRRVVCYDAKKESLLRGYEKARDPIKLVNFSSTRSESGLDEDVVLSKRSRIELVNNNDITFEYDDHRCPETERRFTSVGTVQSLEAGEQISVKGCLTVRLECAQQVTMKRGSSVVTMLDRCVVTDGSGTIRLTVWGELIQQIANDRCYIIENVVVKQYNSAKFLTTTHSTRITPTEEIFPSASKELFDGIFDVEKVVVEKISFANRFKKWLSCSECGREISEVTSLSIKIVKCVYCNTAQPVSSCTMKASARIAIRDSNHKLIWLKLLTAELQEMLNQPAPDVTLESSEEDIYEQLFDGRNFTVEYDKMSLVVKGIYFEAL